MQYEKPKITRLENGMFSCTYKNPDGSLTNLIGATKDELVERLSVAHQSSVAALQRSRRAFETIKSQTLDQKTRELDDFLQEAKRNEAVFKFKQANPEYVSCIANRDLLLQWISANGMDVTAESLQAAFEVNQHRLAKAPKTYSLPTVEAAPTKPAEPSLPRRDRRLPSRDELLTLARENKEEFARLVRLCSSREVDAVLRGEKI